MSAALLDVNVLIALFHAAHINHLEAHRWFGANRRRGWATCPITINGCVRVLSNPRYPILSTTPGEVMTALSNLCSAADHQFWAEDVSLLDEQLFLPARIAGHQKITDVYLLGLAVRKRGVFVTFDRSIPYKAVVGADASHLRVLGGTAEAIEN
ncbi:MAG: TA system VapC family ribonuclease toxin [Bryobacteraceae bacterium]